MSITLLDNHPLPSALKKEFQNRLSKKPYCSNDLEFGLQIRNKQVALSKKYIQANTPFNLSWLCFDIDYPCVLETTFKEKILPSPNIIVVNPKNHHSHLLYGIKQQVHLTDNSSIEPIRYAHAIQYALREELKADSGYTGLIIKNPQNDEWHTKELTESLWSLGELAEYLKLPNKIPKKEMFIGLGRNCTLFENARYFAYSEVLKYKVTSTKESFYYSVLKFIEDTNREFTEPLQHIEYKAIAKSISNWTWKYYGNKTTQQWFNYVKRTHSVELQSWRGKQNTSEQQAIKGKIGGLANTKESQSIKGKIGAIKSAEVRFEGSNEQLKPWKDLGISRAWYYKQKKLSNI